jgi:hypothetical protein
MSIVAKLRDTEAEKVKQVFAELLEAYLSPAFGSMSKRDFEILLFTKLQDLDLFEQNPDLYILVSELKVTRVKARNLLYESGLRQTSVTALDEELKNLIVSPIFLQDNDKIGLEIQNPFVIDHLKAKLRKLKYITDGSFSPELVKLTPAAFIALFDSYIPEKSKKDILKTFIEMGLKKDTSFTGLLKGVLKSLGKKIADEAGSKIAETAADFLDPFIKGSVDLIKEKFNNLLPEA